MDTNQERTTTLPARRTLTLSYALSLLIAILMAAASVAGLLYPANLYPADELRQSFLPTDLVNLLIGLPILLGSMWLARRGRLIGLLLWPGALFYVLYNYLVYVFAMPLNVAFLLHLTLVTLSLFKGTALLIVPKGVSAIKSNADQTMPAWINNFARQEVLLGLPMAFYVAVFVVHLLIVVQNKTLLGKYAAAIGGNRTAAELSGINVVLVVWILYIIVGLFAALAGVSRASYMSLGDPLSGDGMELACIIAVLLGGTAFSGGEGSVAKTMVGAIIIMCVTIGLMTVIPAYWQTLATGSVLLVAVALNHLLVREGTYA